MKKQIALNVFFYVGVFVSVIGLKWAWQNHNYPAVGIFVATAIFFFYLKVKLIRELRSSIKNKTN